jgi:hypothetical protein
VNQNRSVGSGLSHPIIRKKNTFQLIVIERDGPPLAGIRVRRAISGALGHRTLQALRKQLGIRDQHNSWTFMYGGKIEL